MNREDYLSSFETLRGALLSFLGDRSQAFPDQATAITTVANEIRTMVMPDPLPRPRRLPGCRHLAAALEMARGGPMASLAEAFAAFEPAMRWIQTQHYRQALPLRQRHYAGVSLEHDDAHRSDDHLVS